ncbi:MAG: glycosyltransferase family 87 protein [Planctomycetota bacterium]
MSEFLLYYKRPDPTTWVYLSSFLTIGLYFVFHRFWSVRNLDIVLLILLAPGLLMVHEGRRRHLREMESGVIAEADPEDSIAAVLVTTSYEATGDTNETSSDGRPAVVEPTIQQETNVPLVAEPEALDERLEQTALDPDSAESAEEVSAKQLQKNGFVLLFVVEMLILVRLMIDPMMNRRPLLDPNLKIGGLYFISICLFIFMMANVATSTPRTRVWQGPELGPGYALMHKLPTITTRPVSAALAGAEPATEDELDLAQKSRTLLAKILVIGAHLAVVVGIVLIANRHFGNLHAGVGCATLYLILPYTAQMTGRVDHAVPAALLLWAVLNYRRPMLAGLFIGLAAGLVYYPLFLLPLWCSFYWQRGVRRFAVGVAATLVFLMLLLSLGGTDTLIDHLRWMYGLFPPTNEPRGIWGLGWSPVWRLPVIVAFAILSFFFAAWPSPKNLGALIGCSAAVMVAAQFWHGYGGGLYIAWFLPLLLLTIFRPNLQDRIALKVVDRRQSGSLSGRIQSM